MCLVQADVVQPMRNNLAFAVARKIVVEDFKLFARVELAVAIEVTQQLLFLRIDADDRLAVFEIFRLELPDTLKLRVALRMGFERLLFLGLPPGKTIAF